MAQPTGVDNENALARTARMQWWRDAKFGLFIHWDPSSVQAREISWSRGGSKPLEAGGDPAGVVPDPVYDNLYKAFNPTNFDANDWVKLAKDAGMKYMVFTCKHHNGFSMWDTKFRDYNISHTPYGRDIVRQLTDACHASGMRIGVYYSPRDWTQADYGQGDNRKYADFMNGQLSELLGNYGKIDIAWFDSYGFKGDGTTFWRIPETYALIKSLQPQIIINNRLSALSGINNPPCSRGDFDTPEQSIGTMNVTFPWESCMTLSAHDHWSWAGDQDGVKPYSECLRMLISCVCGDGNLLLDAGPRPDGTIDKQQADILRRMGSWLAQYGESIYDTRGGPYRNGNWGGSTFRGNIVYIHVLDWSNKTLKLSPLEGRILSTRVLTGEQVVVEQSAKGLNLTLNQPDPAVVDTIIELTLDQPVTKVQTLAAKRSIFEEPIYGQRISDEATVNLSSTSPQNDREPDHSRLFTGPVLDYAIHTKDETDAWAIVDLGKNMDVMGVHIENRDGRSAGLVVSVSEDGQQWIQVWKDPAWDAVWEFPVTRIVAGANVLGIQARYLKLEKKTDGPSPLILRRVLVYGQK